MEYTQIFEDFKKQDIRYLICGGLAVNLYGIPRMTADIDLLLDMEYTNLRRFEICMINRLYQSQLPFKIELLSSQNDRVKLIKEKNLIAYSYYNQQANVMNMDVLIDVPIVFAEMWERKEVRKVGQTSINIVNIEDLIKLKQYSNRKQDQDDIYLLSQIKDGRI
jgi:hypothetical protein